MTKIRLNVLILAALAALVVAILARTVGVSDATAVVGAASVVLGFYGSTMYLLAKPEPNPDVDRAFAEYTLHLARGGDPHKTAPVASQSDRRLNVLLTLIIAAVGLSLVALLNWGSIPVLVGVGIANATLGMIGGVVGKLVEPEPDPVIPQSAFTAALDAIKAAAKGSSK